VGASDTAKILQPFLITGNLRSPIQRYQGDGPYHPHLRPDRGHCFTRQRSVNHRCSTLFKAAVLGTSNTAVLWGVVGTVGAGAAMRYVQRAESTLLPRTTKSLPLLITATSVADSESRFCYCDHRHAELAVNINTSFCKGAVNAAAVHRNGPTVTGTAITGVTWSVTGTGCSGAACGTVSSTGLLYGSWHRTQPCTDHGDATSKEDGKRRLRPQLQSSPRRGGYLADERHCHSWPATAVPHQCFRYRETRP